jgi:signal peptidase I
VTQSEPESRPKRPPRQIKAAALILDKEARRIVRKFAARLAPEPLERIRACVSAIEIQRRARDWSALERTTEELDELLHQHASFGRKSALRETLENVSVAVLVAVALRSCVYEPFKIPSGSMMPTLRAGDHIFVNKFTYGIQIPLTNTVVGQGIGEPERGDVIVFRYPIDESEDFIKRVMALPGDTLKVDGNTVSIRRAGEAEFERLTLTKVDEHCQDEGGTRIVSGCEVFEESLDGRTHQVRYMTGDPRLGVQRRQGEWTVPEGHVLVMGDNRNQSHDSLAWTRQVEAVSADSLLTIKDLRDLTAERLFALQRPDDGGRQDPARDHILYLADHRSEPRDLSLEVWRDPTLGVAAVFAANEARLLDARRVTVTELLDASSRYGRASNLERRAQILQNTAPIDALSLGRGEGGGWQALAQLGESKAILQLRCGEAVCREDVEVIERLAAAMERFQHNHDQDANQLLEGEKGIRYTNHWTSRSSDRLIDRIFIKAKAGVTNDDPAARVRLRVWRDTDEGAAFVRSVALHALTGGAPERAIAAPDLGREAWITSDERGSSVIVEDPAGVVFVLECGRQRCPNVADAQSVLAPIVARTPELLQDRRAIPELVTASDLGDGWRAQEVEPRTRHEYDRVWMEGTERTQDRSAELWLWLRPAQGLETAVAALAAVYPLVEADPRLPFGQYAALDDRHALIFAVPSSEVVVQLECRRGLCADREAVNALAQRIADKAQDPSNFIDPNAERPSPFVPRGHIKGRADRIWLPLRRFWLPIR